MRRVEGHLDLLREFLLRANTHLRAWQVQEWGKLMASIWMRLSSIPPDEFVNQVVTPLVQALGSNGLHGNLEPTANSIVDNEGHLAYSLFPGGELSLVFTTGPTTDSITGLNHSSCYAMATISRIPRGYPINEDNITTALHEFESSLFERGIYDASVKITPGGSFGGQARIKASGAGSSNGAPGGSSGGCYVATAVYGGYDVAQVRVLRRFRDQKLQRTPVGRVVVRGYYRLGPALVAQFGNKGWFTRLLRPPLDRMARLLQARGYSDSAYDDTRQPR